MSLGKVYMPNGGNDKYQLIVQSEPASMVSAQKDDITIFAKEKNGLYFFKKLDSGHWTITSSSPQRITTKQIDIIDETKGELLIMPYIFTPLNFNLTNYGTLGINYLVVDDNDNEILPEDWGYIQNWKIKLLTNGTLICNKSDYIDVFLVGGGGGGGGGNSTYKGGPGGGSGKTLTQKNIALVEGTSYAITIGAGGAGGAGSSGAVGSTGGTTSAFNFSIAGGTGGNYSSGAGGNGGSGGAGMVNAGTLITGGSDGSDGTTGDYAGGAGQGTTTREFGLANGTLYATGGYGGRGANPINNTGNGGDGGIQTTGLYGSSGIVIIRNSRQEGDETIG